MSDTPRRFDQAEFERILRRAVELQAEDGDRDFDEADVLSAARELGIPDGVTRAAAREVVGPDAAPSVARPTGATVQISEKEGVLTLVAPPLGADGRRGRTLLVGACWMIAALVWAAEVARSSLGLAILAFPFVLLILAWLGPILRAVLEHAELRLEPRAGELVRRVGPVSWRVQLDPAHLSVRLGRSGDGALDPHHYLLLEDRHVRAAILRRRDAPELLWVDAELTAWLKAQQKPTPA